MFVEICCPGVLIEGISLIISAAGCSEPRHSIKEQVLVTTYSVNAME